jgi:hypothetical protein
MTWEDQVVGVVAMILPGTRFDVLDLWDAMEEEDLTDGHTRLELMQSFRRLVREGLVIWTPVALDRSGMTTRIWQRSSVEVAGTDLPGE